MVDTTVIDMPRVHLNNHGNGCIRQLAALASVYHRHTTRKASSVGIKAYVINRDKPTVTVDDREAMENQL